MIVRVAAVPVILVLALAGACKPLQKSPAATGSQLASVQVGKFEPAAEGKAWTSGRIEFFDVASKKLAFPSRSITSGKALDMQIPYGNYYVRLKYYGADKRNPLYSECRNEQGEEIIHKIETPDVILNIEICDMEEIKDSLVKKADKKPTNSSTSQSTGSTGAVAPSLGSFEDRMKKARESLAKVSPIVSQVAKLATALKNISDADLNLLQNDKTDLALSYVCQKITKFKTDLNASPETELSSSQKMDATKLLETLVAQDQLCEASFSVEKSQ